MPLTYRQNFEKPYPAVVKRNPRKKPAVREHPGWDLGLKIQMPAEMDEKGQEADSREGHWPPAGWKSIEIPKK